MSTLFRTALFLVVAATLSACAQQPQGIDLSAPPAKRVDAKTSLENPGKY